MGCDVISGGPNSDGSAQLYDSALAPRETGISIVHTRPLHILTRSSTRCVRRMSIAPRPQEAVDLVLEYIDKAGIRKCLAVTAAYVFRLCGLWKHLGADPVLFIPTDSNMIVTIWRRP